MGIETRSLIFDNVITYETIQLREDWLEPFYLMKDFPMAEGVYQNGPIFFSVQPEPGEDKFGHFTYHLPINGDVKFSGNDQFAYMEHFGIEDTLVLRQADQEVDFHKAYEKMKSYAEQEGIPLEDTFYVVILEVYDDFIIDLYVPKRGDIR